MGEELLNDTARQRFVVKRRDLSAVKDFSR